MLAVWQPTWSCDSGFVIQPSTLKPEPYILDAHLVVGLCIADAVLLVPPVGQRVDDVAHVPVVVAGRLLQHLRRGNVAPEPCCRGSDCWKVETFYVLALPEEAYVSLMPSDWQAVTSWDASYRLSSR